MIRYELSWEPSDYPGVENNQIVGIINGGPETVLVDNIPSTVVKELVTFADEQVGQSGVVWVRTHGDNGGTADTPSIAFLITEQDPNIVTPVKNLSMRWHSYVPG